MNILIIGGTYFLGRLLTIELCKYHHLTLVNRGTYSMKEYGVKEYHFDRRHQESWHQLESQNFDVVIDLCAYQRNDVQIVLDALKNQIQHYILISTVDVYKHQTGLYKDENHILEDRHLGGEVGEYIIHKILLEYELQKNQIPYTILRPGHIYGPYNYAPRESLYIQKVISDETLWLPRETQASFQLTYVEDVVKAIQLCIHNKTYNQIYNIVEPTLHNYSDFYQTLKQVSQKDIDIKEDSIQNLLSNGYPLPYPIYDYENEYYNGQKIVKDLNLKYTSLSDGLNKTYRAFYHVYKKS